jgi:hypothetical protein
MKQIYTSYKTLFLAILILSISGLRAQNLITNPGFSNGNNGWNYNGMNVEINPESVYGGVAANNNTSEIDMEVGLRQLVAVQKSNSFSFNFVASRRISSITPSPAGIRVKVIGATSGTLYVNDIRTFNNTSFQFQAINYQFNVTNLSNDNNLIIEITNYNNSKTYGVIVDNFSLATNSTLPVVFKSFTAKSNAADVVLNWSTATEINNKHFVVERSVNGADYTAIGTVAANITYNYQFTDSKVSSPVVYYRLKQVDIDGNSTYSIVVKVNNQASVQLTDVYPNPARSNVNVSISVANAASYQLHVISNNGKVVVSKSLNVTAGSSQHSVSLETVSAGVYYLVLVNTQNGTVTQKQFVKS